MFRVGCHHQARGTTTGTTNSERLDFGVGLSTAFAVAPPEGASPRSGESMPPRRGKKEKGRRQGTAHNVCAPTGPARLAVVRTLPKYHTNRTNRLEAVLRTVHAAQGIRTNRTNRVQTVLQTVHAARTNCTNRYDLGGGNSTPLNYGLYGLYEILERRARFVGWFVYGLYGLYEFLKRSAWFVGRRVDGS